MLQIMRISSKELISTLVFRYNYRFASKPNLNRFESNTKCIPKVVKGFLIKTCPVVITRCEEKTHITLTANKSDEL